MLMLISEHIAMTTTVAIFMVIVMQVMRIESTLLLLGLRSLLDPGGRRGELGARGDDDVHDNDHDGNEADDGDFDVGVAGFSSCFSSYSSCSS